MQTPKEPSDMPIVVEDADELEPMKSNQFGASDDLLGSHRSHAEGARARIDKSLRDGQAKRVPKIGLLPGDPDLE